MTIRSPNAATLSRICVLAACLGAVCGPAQADARFDAALETAAQEAEQGHPAAAAQTLARLADAGSVPAMERLALKHRYGPLLYPHERWQPLLASHWFEQAARRDSPLARHMLTRAGSPLRAGRR